MLLHVTSNRDKGARLGRNAVQHNRIIGDQAAVSGAAIAHQRESLLRRGAGMSPWLCCKAVSQLTLLQLRRGGRQAQGQSGDAGENGCAGQEVKQFCSDKAASLQRAAPPTQRASSGTHRSTSWSRLLASRSAEMGAAGFRRWPWVWATWLQPMWAQVMGRCGYASFR